MSLERSGNIYSGLRINRVFSAGGTQLPSIGKASYNWRRNQGKSYLMVQGVVQVESGTKCLLINQSNQLNFRRFITEWYFHRSKRGFIGGARIGFPLSPSVIWNNAR